MKATKAVVTAASPAHRTLPLQTLVDRDGQPRSVLEILLREIQSAGIEDVCLIIHPGDEEAYRDAARGLGINLSFVEQRERLGYGHALSLAHDFLKGEAFFHTVCDHLFISRDPDRSCARQLVEHASRAGTAMSAVQSTRETEIHLYGAVSGVLTRSTGAEPVYQIRDVIEKPTPTEAEQRLIVPGLRAGQYLTFFGMHVLTPLVMELLRESVQTARSQGGQPNVQLSPVLSELARREQYGAVVVQGSRHHISLKYGLFYTQLALALHGSDKPDVLTELVQLLARSHQ
jgi:UTP--glucose-1-phosphate uridylyltransferase